MNINNAIKEIIKVRGIEIIKEPKIFCAILDDLIPQARIERTIIRRTLIPYPELSEKIHSILALKDPSEEAINKLLLFMRSSCGISEDWIKVIINAFWEDTNIDILENQLPINKNKFNRQECSQKVNNEDYIRIDYLKYINIIPRIKSGNFQFFVKQDGTVFYAGYEEGDRNECINEEMKSIKSWKNIIAIDVCSFFTDHYDPVYVVFGLKRNGTINLKVISPFDNTIEKYFNIVRQWTDVIRIVTGYNHILALKSDGTVLAAGKNTNGELNVSSWESIKDIFATVTLSIGLKNDQSIIATEGHRYTNFDTSLLHGIEKIGRSDSLSLFVNNRGGVIIAGDSSSYDNDKVKEVKSWTNINKIISDEYIVGLTKEGKVCCVNSKSNKDISVETSKWEDIVEIDTAYSYVVALSANGRIQIAGTLDDNNPIKISQDDLNRLKGICSFTLLGSYIIALKVDGCFEYVNVYGKDYYDYGKNDTMTALSNFRLFDSIETYCEELQNNTYFFDNGDSYLGQWKNGKMHGQGRYFWKQGDSLSGNFVNGMANNCEGVIYSKDSKFTGALTNGKKTGRGVLEFNNGNRFEGEFLNGEMHEGVFCWHDNTQWEGILKNDEPYTGEGTWHFKDGTVKSGKWKNGRKKLFG